MSSVISHFTAGLFVISVFDFLVCFVFGTTAESDLLCYGAWVLVAYMVYNPRNKPQPDKPLNSLCSLYSSKKFGILRLLLFNAAFNSFLFSQHYNPPIPITPRAPRVFLDTPARHGARQRTKKLKIIRRTPRNKMSSSDYERLSLPGRDISMDVGSLITY